MGNAYRILILKPEGKRQLGKRRSIWDNNIKMDVKGRKWDDMSWIHLRQHRNQ
jgi:hypothetical protein